MGVQVDRNIDFGFQFLDKIVCRDRQKQVCHILDADRISTHLHELLCELNKVIIVMHRAYGVADSGFTMSAVFLCKLYGRLKVSNIVKSIEYADNIDTVLYRLAAELLYNIICIMLVSENVLSAEQHLKSRVR